MAEATDGAKVRRRQRTKQLSRTENQEGGHCGWSGMSHSDRRWEGRATRKAGGHNKSVGFISITVARYSFKNTSEDILVTKWLT